MNPAAAFAVTDDSHVAEPRRVVRWLATQLGFSEERTGRAALIVSELGTNLAKHARHGEILLGALHSADGESEGLEILAVDKGPGIPDVALSRRDGYSTSGTLGHGLGAIERQADWFELYTQSSGTIIAARLWRDKPQRAIDNPLLEVGAVQVSKGGEAVCGDAWSWRMRPGRLSIFLADGLGHGPAAHDAAAAAVNVFAQHHESAPARLIGDVHAALRSTRGAAIGAAVIDLERRVTTFAGLGNITGTILLPGSGRHNLVSHNGTAGHTAGRIQEFSYPVPRGSIIVLYSDGLQTHWDLTPYPGLTMRSASVIAGALYRDFSRRRDDATVIVVKERRPSAERP